MKLTLIILGALALGASAQAAEKNYQYKDLNTEEARPFVKGSEAQKASADRQRQEYRKPAKTIEEKIQESNERKGK